MNAILVRSSTPEALVYERVRKPHPGSGEVLVRVHAAAITPTELSWLGDLTKPVIPSHEMSGVVTELGAGVDEIEVGTEVYGLPDFAGDGAAADYVAMPAANLARKPRSLDHLHAAAMPLSALTAVAGPSCP
jgi:NADPH:quinone reductase-like Zn-dependent oxidoreductase